MATLPPGSSAFIGAHVSLPNGQFGYTLTAPEPAREAVTGTFVFLDHPTFRPNLSPAEILQGGAFGGSYFRPWRSSKLQQFLVRDWEDLPANWYEGLSVDELLTRPEPSSEVNRWKALVGQSLDEWEKQGWTAPRHDPRGWFQWYCRFFRGRRCDDDDRQVDRWVKVASASSGRWRRILYGKYAQANETEVSRHSETVSPAIRQTLRHWAYEISTEDLTAFREEKGFDVANHPTDLDQGDFEGHSADSGGLAAGD